MKESPACNDNVQRGLEDVEYYIWSDRIKKKYAVALVTSQSYSTTPPILHSVASA